MITKGIVEELKGYQAKVRLPIYDGLANTKNATSNENLSYATVCVTTNLNNSLNVGDIVYVSFEDNDKGKPVILGQLYKEEMNTLADIKLNSANINQLTVNKNASLPQNTSIGSISSKEIAALSGIKDNIQNQIDNSVIYSQSIISNPNLLINGDFRVNQRGQTSYTGTGYTVDRWRNVGFKSLTVTPTNTGITLVDTVDTATGYLLSYKFEDKDYLKLQGKTITISFKVSKNTGSNIYIRLLANGENVGGTNTTNNTGIFSKTITLPTSLTSLEFHIRKSSGELNCEIEYAKLELGSVATANNSRPYAEELAMCQRYYQNINTVSSLLYARTTNQLRAMINFKAEMRTRPTLTQLNTIRVFGPIEGTTFSQTSAGIGGGTAINKEGIMVALLGFSGLTQNNIYQLDLGVSAEPLFTVDAEIY